MQITNKMTTEIKNISSEGDLLNRLKEDHRETQEYLNLIKNREDICYGQVLIGVNWHTCVTIANKKEIADYFPDSITKEAKELIKKWNNLIDKCGKKAYFQFNKVREANFPWYDDLGLLENLNKSLTPEEMMRYCANSLSIDLGYNDVDWVQSTALEKIRIHPDTQEIYEKKKNLEEEMMGHLGNLLSP